jgi:hypothetical protein
VQTKWAAAVLAQISFVTKRIRVSKDSTGHQQFFLWRVFFPLRARHGHSAAILQGAHRMWSRRQSAAGADQLLRQIARSGILDFNEMRDIDTGFRSVHPRIAYKNVRPVVAEFACVIVNEPFATVLT